MTAQVEPITPPSGDGLASALRVAVIGSGPAGFFAAGAILKSFPGATVNMFERLPTPWGLLRAGIAPDHENMRVLGAVFDKTGQHPDFNLIANVEIGRDLSHQDLLGHHHAVIYATGAPHGRRLRVAGEQLPNSFTSGQFVGWYNGHPDFVDINPDLSHERAVVIGNGNVALDIARMLSRDVEELRSTDTADHALEALSHSQVREVIVLGRRGPREAAFTLPELTELDKIEGVTVTADLGGVDLAGVDAESLSSEERKLGLLAKMASRATHEPGSRRVHLQFMSQPTRLSGRHGVDHLETASSVLDSTGRVSQGSERESVETGLVVSAVGFESSPIPGVPFDAPGSKIPSIDSRVIDPRTGHSLGGTYVVGWVKRGPSGVLGTNKKCASETIAAIQADFDAGLLDRQVLGNESLIEILSDRDEIVDFAGWQKINELERRRGVKQGRPRVKFVDRRELLAAASDGR